MHTKKAAKHKLHDTPPPLVSEAVEANQARGMEKVIHASQITSSFGDRAINVTVLRALVVLPVRALGSEPSSNLLVVEAPAEKSENIAKVCPGFIAAALVLLPTYPVTVITHSIRRVRDRKSVV